MKHGVCNSLLVWASAQHGTCAGCWAQCILVWYEHRQTCPVCDRKMDMDGLEASLA